MYYSLYNQCMCEYTLVLTCLSNFYSFINMFTFYYLWSKIRSCKNIYIINQLCGPQISGCITRTGCWQVCLYRVFPGVCCLLVPLLLCRMILVRTCLLYYPTLLHSVSIRRNFELCCHWQLSNVYHTSVFHCFGCIRSNFNRCHIHNERYSKTYLPLIVTNNEVSNVCLALGR
jgi:hypothetical protein